ncbi:HAD family hydrolase [Alphaproteobacteria bacterium KMM 3653]|uniref:phosphoglycolate phosphatase n=1 Tax=Harenicola maris TaxID=2841044 RepID=A0AAP2G9V2_9RHOB|nr:HAD family hydrolase [Harenicola maris]
MSGLAPIKGVLFDKDGTLFDLHATWGHWGVNMCRDLAAGNARVEAALAGAMMLDLGAARFDPASPVVAGTPAEIAALLTPHLPAGRQESLLAEMNAAAARAPQVPVVPLVPYLQGLRESGLRLGVATNDAQAAAMAHLAAHDTVPLFDFIAGYDSGYGHKPGPGPCLAFAKAMGLAPEACVMVGDSTHDLRAGRAAGMRCAAVLTGTALEETLAPLADVVLRDIGALPGWIAQQG